jgi:hypothetical protein
VFDALKLHEGGLILPQVPQRGKEDKHDPSSDLVANVGGSLAAWGFSDRLEPKTLILAGAGIWSAAYVAGRVSFGEPHDYFGRENAPSNLSYGILALVGGFGSTWVFQGAWRWFRGR